jgi:hypothetical protein
MDRNPQVAKVKGPWNRRVSEYAHEHECAKSGMRISKIFPV